MQRPCSEKGVAAVFIYCLNQDLQDFRMNRMRGKQKTSQCLPDLRVSWSLRSKRFRHQTLAGLEGNARSGGAYAVALCQQVSQYVHPAHPRILQILIQTSRCLLFSLNLLRRYAFDCWLFIPNFAAQFIEGLPHYGTNCESVCTV